MLDRSGSRRLSPLALILRRRCERAPERPALHLREGRAFVPWTWAALLKRSLTAAAGLREEIEHMRAAGELVEIIARMRLE